MPADVFSLNSGWTGFYEYLGKRQTATITVTTFNATTSRVNVTLLEQSGVQLKLSGELLNPFKINIFRMAHKRQYEMQVQLTCFIKYQKVVIFCSTSF